MGFQTDMIDDNVPDGALAETLRILQLGAAQHSDDAPDDDEPQPAPAAFSEQHNLGSGPCQTCDTRKFSEMRKKFQPSTRIDRLLAMSDLGRQFLRNRDKNKAKAK